MDRKRELLMRLRPCRLVFIDETAVATGMTRRRGHSLFGERLQADALFGQCDTQIFIAGLRCPRLKAPWVNHVAMDRMVFDLWVETQLAPTLQPGDIVTLGNLSVHESASVAVILEARTA